MVAGSFGGMFGALPCIAIAYEHRIAWIIVNGINADYRVQWYPPFTIGAIERLVLGAVIGGLFSLQLTKQSARMAWWSGLMVSFAITCCFCAVGPMEIRG
jgi:Na+/proline symporter